MCISDKCNGSNYYRGLLTPAVSSASVVEYGTEVCVPCNEGCIECTGPEGILGSNGCRACRRFVGSTALCVAECNATGMYKQVAKQVNFLVVHNYG